MANEWNSLELSHILEATIAISFSGVKSHTPSFFTRTHNCFFYPLFTAKQSEFDNLWMMIVAAKGAAVVAVAVVPVGTSSNSNTCTWHIFFSHLSSALFFSNQTNQNFAKLIVSEPPLWTDINGTAIIKSGVIIDSEKCVRFRWKKTSIMKVERWKIGPKRTYICSLASSINWNERSPCLCACVSYCVCV